MIASPFRRNFATYIAGERRNGPGSCAVLFVFRQRSEFMTKVAYYTKQGLDKLKSELREMQTKGRADIARQIADARDKGDLSENAEYDAAKDAQGMLETKIAQLEEIVGNARVIDESTIDTSKVSILSKVTIKNLSNEMKFTYTLVSEEEADLKEGKISVQSPIGSGLLGKEKGEKATITTPGGKVNFEIMDISV